jgi:hypothetical protein
MRVSKLRIGITHGEANIPLWSVKRPILRGSLQTRDRRRDDGHSSMPDVWYTAAAVGAERLREVMAEPFNRASTVVRGYGARWIRLRGTVDKFTGDGIIALYCAAYTVTQLERCGRPVPWALSITSAPAPPAS